MKSPCVKSTVKYEVLARNADPQQSKHAQMTVPLYSHSGYVSSFWNLYVKRNGCQSEHAFLYFVLPGGAAFPATTSYSDSLLN